MMRPIIILGGGGHARVVIDLLQELGREILGYTTPDSSPDTSPLLGVHRLGNDDYLHGPQSSKVELVNGIGSTGQKQFRRELYVQYKQKGYYFATIVHPHSTVSKHATLSEGVQVMAGSVIQPNCQIGVNSIVNTRASVDHDCIIGDHVHIAPAATLSGGVRVGDRTHIGTGATIIQGIHIGEGCMIAAGAVVVRDVPDGAVIVGVPGRERFQ